MKPDNYFDQVINQTAEILLSVPILSQIHIMPSSKLHFLFSQIYYFIEMFPGFLGTLIWQTNNEKIRFALIENLVDECGGFDRIRNRDYSATHSGMLKKFIEGINGSRGVLAEKSVHTKIFIRNFEKLFINSTFIETLGAMASMESVSTKWFNLIYQQLIKRNEFSEESLYFFKLHIQMDEDHGDVLKETLIPLLKNNEDYVLFKNGAMTSVNNWKNFYFALAEEIAGEIIEAVR